MAVTDEDIRVAAVAAETSRQSLALVAQDDNNYKIGHAGYLEARDAHDVEVLALWDLVRTYMAENA